VPASSIPAVDSTPLPGPAGLFQILLVATFVIHLVFVNLVVGGSVVAAAAALFRKDAASRRISRFLTEVNAWAVSLAITFGVAPLLFLQVLHGRFFYAATVLVAWRWLGMLVLLLAAYYLTYVAKYGLRAGKSAAVPLTLSALLYLAIAATQVAVHLLYVQPERWGPLADGVTGLFTDPAFAPRFLHFVLAGISTAAMLLAWKEVRKEPAAGETETATAVARLGVKVALVATVLQILDGAWLTVALPGPVLVGLMKGGGSTMGPFAAGITASLLLVVVLSGITEPLAQRSRVRHALELILGTMILMTVTRHQVRMLYLAGHDGPTAISAQWGAFALFLLAFVACLALTVFAVVRAVKNRPAEGEEVA
jgi:hypothetical protein